MMPYGVIELSQTGSGNQFWPDNAKPFPWNNSWVIYNEVLWHSPEGNYTGNAEDIYVVMSLKIINS